ncbi:DUF84 family protein [Anaerobacillus sp. CMMVII]|uniref:DUF84 family protein n=1 Tax=Anaerobacillus sp. CMMVII TaxID=2755588 RepID=UPI0021B725B1|nr:DUF84 family protein [Anaerobacillus sp. CMMVII]MCT8137321.1 DUF84 family protein [Anaerobacillus sp. CMMVII]
MKVAVGSTNPTKVKAVHNVVGDLFEVIPLKVPSDVSEQPFGDQETVTGALNRAKTCLEVCEADFAIGLEGGVAETEYGMLVINWGALVDRDGNEYIASGARAILPDEVASLVRDGRTLGEAMDLYTKRLGVSKLEGAMGIITNSRINRDEMFSHVVKVLIGQYEFHKGQSI